MKMTNFAARSLLFFLATGLAAATVSCEKPELVKADPDTPPSATAATTAATTESASPETAAPPAPAEKAPPAEPDYPELEVYREGDSIVIRGALKSRMQKARIAEEMARDFPGLQIDDQLLVESHRYPVGWGNRVSLAFLVPYFMEVKNPYVAFRKGVVILKGECSKPGDIRHFQELAINVFAGMHLKDIENEMKVRGN